MRPDVHELQAFYESRQGQIVRRLIVRRIRAIWPSLARLRVLGIGYPAPYLGALEGAAERVLALMPAGQGAHAWPRLGANRTALVREDELPLPDGAVDRILLVHALEGCDNGRRFLREVWRVLADGGRVLAVVPNRRGLWCLSERTPFGHGRPYSPAQLGRALDDSLFVPGQSGRALYVPPRPGRFWLRTAVAWERIGLRLAPHFAGVLLLEAEKRIAVGLPVTGRPRPARTYAPVPARLSAAERNGHEPLRPAARTREEPA